MSQLTNDESFLEDGEAPEPGFTVPKPAADSETSTSDREFFIRHAFGVNPVTGYELLFRHYYGPLCNHAVRYVYTKEVAQDLVADVFYTFWTKENYKDVSSSFRAYLFSAVRYKCLNYLRWEFFKENADELEHCNAVSQIPQPDHIMEFDELYFKIEKTIELLPNQCRKVFLMSRFEGKSHKEIAEALDVSKKAIEGHMSKALAIFRKALK